MTTARLGFAHLARGILTWTGTWSDRGTPGPRLTLEGLALNLLVPDLLHGPLPQLTRRLVSDFLLMVFKLQSTGVNQKLRRTAGECARPIRAPDQAMGQTSHSGGRHHHQKCWMGIQAGSPRHVQKRYHEFQTDSLHIPLGLRWAIATTS